MAREINQSTILNRPPHSSERANMSVQSNGAGPVDNIKLAMGTHILISDKLTGEKLVNKRG